MLLGALLGSGINVPAAGTDGGLILTEWVVDYAEGRVRMAWDVREDSTDKQSKVDDFNELLDKIADNPAYYDAMLNGGSAGETSLRVRGYVLDNEDQKSIANGDFDPEFTIEQEF